MIAQLAWSVTAIVFLLCPMKFIQGKLKGKEISTILFVASFACVLFFTMIRGARVGKKLAVGFLDEGKKRGISNAHLYAVPSNKPAMKMYKDIGFVPWNIENEPRPSDAHLIYWI